MLHCQRSSGTPFRPVLVPLITFENRNEQTGAGSSHERSQVSGRLHVDEKQTISRADTGSVGETVRNVGETQRVADREQ